MRIIKRMTAVTWLTLAAAGSMTAAAQAQSTEPAIQISQDNSRDATRVHASIEGDAVFPSLDRKEWRETQREEHGPQPGDDHAFTLITLSRA